MWVQAENFACWCWKRGFAYTNNSLTLILERRRGKKKILLFFTSDCLETTYLFETKNFLLKILKRKKKVKAS